MGDPRIRVVGQVEDMDGAPLIVGVDYDTVTLQAARPDGLPVQLASHQAEEFGRLYIAACWEAARQGGELAAAARCPADCGATTHDTACHGKDRTP